LASAAALIAGVALLTWSPRSASDGVTWDDLLAPYSHGAPLPNGFRVERIFRARNDVVVSAQRPEDSAHVEVHVIRRGQWTGVLESESFGIGYEIPHSSASIAEDEAVTRALADVIRQRDHGLPSPAEIALGGLDHDALPWWLGIWRGGRGVLLGLNLILLGLLALAPTRGLAVAAFALVLFAALAAVAGIPAQAPTVPGAVLVLGAALALGIGVRRPGASSGDVAAALLIFAGALALRLALGTWGPLRINGLGPLWIAGAAGVDDAVATYGPGYRDLFGPLVGLAPSSPDWVIFGANAVLSALIAPLTFVLARLLHLSTPAAAAAALLLAIDPVAIAGAATESYFPVIIALCAAAAIAIVAAEDARRPGAPRREVAAVLGAALLVTLAARVHPAAWGLVAVVPFVAVAPAPARPSQLVSFAGVALLVAGLLAATSGTALVEVLVNLRTGALMRPPTPPSLAPLAWLAGAAGAYALLTRRLGLAIAATAWLAALLESRHVYNQSALWQASYDRLYFVVPAVALAALVPARLWRSIVFVAAAAAGLGWVTVGRSIVATRTTDHLEYRWLRQHLAELPADCRIIHVGSAGTRSLVLPTYVGAPPHPAVDINLNEPLSIARALSPAACVYYVRGSLCSSAAGRPACDAIEQRLVLSPVARVELPARPSNDGLPYDVDPVPTAIERVERIDGVPVTAGAPPPT
jgi:hypothetical protein